MSQPTLVGTYTASKADWFAITEPGQATTNYGRWQIAHSGASSFGNKTYSFALTDPTEYVPDNDTSNRTTAHNLGVAGNRDVATGADFLWRGNYIHPTLVINDVNGVVLSPTAQAYYAGSSTSFDSGPPGAITRGWIEIICSQDLPTVATLVDGGSYVINGITTLCCTPTIPKVLNLNVTWLGGPSGPVCAGLSPINTTVTYDPVYGLWLSVVGVDANDPTNHWAVGCADSGGGVYKWTIGAGTVSGGTFNPNYMSSFHDATTCNPFLLDITDIFGSLYNVFCIAEAVVTA